MFLAACSPDTVSHWLFRWWEGGWVSQTGSRAATSSENIWFNCANKRRYSVFHCYSSCISAMGIYSNSAWCLRPAKSLWRNAERWSAWLSLGVCVFVFQCVKPLGLNIAGILSLFPFLPVSLAHSFSHALAISLLFLAVVPPWRRQQWPYCERWEMGSGPMMSSCHREERRERPPGVQSALFFPVVFRKAVINLIPSSSLPASGWWGWWKMEEGQMEKVWRIEKHGVAFRTLSQCDATKWKEEEKMRWWLEMFWAGEKNQQQLKRHWDLISKEGVYSYLQRENNNILSNLTSHVKHFQSIHSHSKGLHTSDSFVWALKTTSEGVMETPGDAGSNLRRWY